MFALGMLFVFIGILFTSSSHISQKNTKIDIVDVKAIVGTPYEYNMSEWYVQGPIEAGENVTLSFVCKWEVMPNHGTLFPVNFSIIDPNGRKAIFTVDFEYVSPPFSEGHVEWHPAVLREKDPEMALTETPGVIGGIATMSGNYTGRVEFMYIVLPFDSLRLEKEKIVLEYPYSSLFPAGIPVLVLGCIIAFLGTKKPRKKIAKKPFKGTSKVHTLNIY